ncbi:MAG: extracellular solute-binding protein [Chloroflexi bacterium]|nr:extracellular solute-binding protein [Chloroflexota bacterium]
MLTRRQFVCRCLALAGSVVLSACAPSAPAQPSGSSSAPTQQPAAPASTAAPSGVSGAPAPTTAPSSAGSAQYKLDLGGYRGPAPTGTAVKLRVMRQVYRPVEDQWWKDRYTEWAEAYPNVTVEEEVVPYGDLNPKLQAYVAAGDPPDVIMGKGDFVRAYVFNAIALNLSDYFRDDFVDDLMPAAKSQQVVDGKLYAMPYEQDEPLLFFNKEMFRKANVPTPTETAELAKGWSWDQMEDAWKRLFSALNPSGEPEVYALASSAYGNGGPGSSYWIEGVFIRSMGDPNAPKDSTAYKTFIGISPDGTTASGYVDTPEAVKGMQIYQRIFQQKLSPSTAVQTQFEDQKAATRFGGGGNIARLRQVGVPFEWSATPVPHGTTAFGHTSGDAPFVSVKTKYPAETAAFLGLLHNDANAVAWFNARGSLPARRSIIDKVSALKEFPYSLAVASAQGGFAPPITPGYLEYFSAMNTAVKDIALGAAVEDRLKKVAKEIDGLLAPYKK